MTRTEFKQIGVDVFLELLPKTKMADIQEFLNVFLAELRDQGLEIEGEVEDDEGDEDRFEDL